MAVDITLMGEFQIKTYTERAFKSAWYGLLETWGQHIQLREGVIWKSEKWNQLKAKMVELFGEPDSTGGSTEKLVDFALRGFGKGLDDLIEINRASFAKRQKYAAQQKEAA